MNGWTMYSDIVDNAASLLGGTGRATGQAWTAANSTIPQGPRFIGPRGNDRLANAFLSGYTLREPDLLYAGESLPLRFRDRASAGHECARRVRQAEAAAAASMPRPN
jgi:hypothetical protein